MSNKKNEDIVEYEKTEEKKVEFVKKMEDYTLLDLIQEHINKVSEEDKKDYGIEYIVSYLEVETENKKQDVKIAVTANRAGLAHTRILFDNQHSLIGQYNYASIKEFLEYLRNSTM